MSPPGGRSYRGRSRHALISGVGLAILHGTEPKPRPDDFARKKRAARVMSIWRERSRRLRVAQSCRDRKVTIGRNSHDQHASAVISVVAAMAMPSLKTMLETR